jgi:hypothetical protein
MIALACNRVNLAGHGIDLNVSEIVEVNTKTTDIMILFQYSDVLAERITQLVTSKPELFKAIIIKNEQVKIIGSYNDEFKLDFVNIYQPIIIYVRTK